MIGRDHMSPAGAGNDLNEDITPVEAGLTWTIGKRRREDCAFLGGEACTPATFSLRRSDLCIDASTLHFVSGGRPLAALQMQTMVYCKNSLW